MTTLLRAEIVGMGMKMQLHTCERRKGVETGWQQEDTWMRANGAWGGRLLLLRKQQDAFGGDETRFRRSRLKRTNSAIFKSKENEKKVGPRRVRENSRGRVRGKVCSWTAPSCKVGKWVVKGGRVVPRKLGKCESEKCLAAKHSERIHSWNSKALGSSNCQMQ